MTKKRPIVIVSIALISVLLIGLVVGLYFKSKLIVPINAAGPTLSDVTEVTTGNIGTYEKFEISFDVDNTSATNFYFPYDASAPTGITSGTGISVNALFLPPGESSWSYALETPCFYYQPMEERGSGDNIGFVPIGDAEWRCRFTPQIEGDWHYKVTAEDSGGTSETVSSTFTCVDSDNKGFIKVSETDSRFFEFSDGSPFLAPLVTVGGTFSSLADIRSSIPELGNNGINFVRWFASGEGADYLINPFGDEMKYAWAFGSAAGTRADSFSDDPATGKIFAFNPYYYSAQSFPAVPNAEYKITIRVKPSGDKVLRLEIGGTKLMDICHTSSTYHESIGETCDEKISDWTDYTFYYTNDDSTSLNFAMRGLYSSTDAPEPYNEFQMGPIHINTLMIQRDESGSGDWGANVLIHSDPTAYDHVDQIAAAYHDEVLDVAEDNDLYLKMTVFHKNDVVLNRIASDGSIVQIPQEPEYFYSADGEAARWYEDAYTRYFVGRWGYSPAIHSLELANENMLDAESYDAGFHFTELVKDLNARPIMMSNSFWGYWVSDYWTDETYGDLIDYSDKHWYANTESTNHEVISTTWDDSAEYVREAFHRFNEYRTNYSYNKPIIRGECGVADTSTQPQHADIAQDSEGTYYRKKTWAHVGTLGDGFDGEWYPRLYSTDGNYPNETYDTFKNYAGYARFMEDEPLNNGNYETIGTDLTGNQEIVDTVTAGSMRAWGSADRTAGNVLLWIDNSNQTWKNVVDGVTITPTSGSLTIQNMPEGSYDAEWWNTKTGTVSENVTLDVTGDGNLTFSIESLDSDKAVKFSLQQETPASTTTTTTTTTSTSVTTTTVATATTSTTLSDFASATTSTSLESSGVTDPSDSEGSIDTTASASEGNNSELPATGKLQDLLLKLTLGSFMFFIGAVMFISNPEIKYLIRVKREQKKIKKNQKMEPTYQEKLFTEIKQYVKEIRL